jgi:4'-phosphopantetheinyl transferase
MDGQFQRNFASTISPPEVDVYHIGPSLDELEIERFVSLLDSSEQAQAARFATAALRRSYVAYHGNLRLALSQYLGIEPNEIRFVRGPHGKPALDPSHGSTLRFNLSHSGERGLIAVTEDREVGIDVERIRALDDWREIATRFFSQRETVRLSSLPRTLVRTAFFATWSRKEAYVKALGLGLALDLGAFEVEVDPREQARLLWTLDDPTGPDQWCMSDIDVGPEYCAAVAVQGQHCRIQLRVVGDGEVTWENST